MIIFFVLLVDTNLDIYEKSIYFDVKTIPFGNNNLKNWA